VTHNPGPPQEHRWLVVFLDIGTGDYWFWPSWVHFPPTFDAESITLESGERIYEIIPRFQWPSGGGEADNLRFWAAILDFDLTRVIGEMGSWTFSYTE